MTIEDLRRSTINPQGNATGMRRDARVPHTHSPSRVPTPHCVEGLGPFQSGRVSTVMNNFGLGNHAQSRSREIERTRTLTSNTRPPHNKRLHGQRRGCRRPSCTPPA